ncbi:amidohydrolase family protein, partial [Marinococcus halophilus]|uniref:amidohydrolase family protein n=1 Tax=Marinococcus halophilus TaxID=1371 RepID=UPI00117C1D14
QTKMVEENVVPVLNPAFIYEFGDGYLTDYGERSEYIFPARDLAEKGLKVAFGSDNPITTINPFVGIYSAITRKTKTGKIVGSEQSISLQEAIKFYTIHGAYASFEENIKGSIEAGKKADFIILDRAILDTPIEEIKNTKVEKTFIDGKVVYENK